MLPVFMFGYLAYQSSNVSIPITLAGIKVDKGTTAYSSAVQSIPGTNLKTYLKPFIDRLGIRKDLIISEQCNTGFCSAMGTNDFTKGDAMLSVAPNLQIVDKDACYFLMKHEISHIKNNDTCTMFLVPAICSLAAYILTCLFPIIPQRPIAILVAVIVRPLFSQYREGKADDLAIKESSIEELKGGWRFFKCLKAYNLKSRTTIWNILTRSSTGENRLDLLHPSIASRLDKVELALASHDITMNEDEETPQINRLASLFEENEIQVQKEIQKLSFLNRIMLNC